MPVIEIFRTAYGFVLGNMGQFFVVAGAYLAVLVVMDTFYDVTGYDVTLFGVVRVIIEALFAFRWHRIYLLGPEYATWTWLPPNSSERAQRALASGHFRFLAWSVVLAYSIPAAAMLAVTLSVNILNLLTPMGVLDLVAGMGVVTAIAIIGFYFLIGPSLSRILPFFPAVAVGGKGASWGEIWRLTQGKGLVIWRCFVLVFVPLVLAGFVVQKLIEIAYAQQIVVNLPGYLLGNFVYDAASLLILAIGVTANSEIYRRLTGFDATATRDEPVTG